jgi:hypothetical protein
MAWPGTTFANPMTSTLVAKPRGKRLSGRPTVCTEGDRLRSCRRSAVERWHSVKEQEKITGDASFTTSVLPGTHGRSDNIRMRIEALPEACRAGGAGPPALAPALAVVEQPSLSGIWRVAWLYKNRYGRTDQPRLSGPLPVRRTRGEVARPQSRCPAGRPSAAWSQWLQVLALRSPARQSQRGAL